MTKFIVIGNTTHALDTDEDYDVAKAALRDVGVVSAPVYSSPTDDVHHPDAVKTSEVLYADK